jgi:5-methylcytosine-specific restriction protein A
MGWETSNRRDSLPPDWPRIRQEQLAWDEYRCTWTLSISGQRCPRRATDVDHKREGRPDLNRVGLDLQSLCEDHHKKKTAIAARRFKAAKAGKRVRPGEGHPGRLS